MSIISHIEWSRERITSASFYLISEKLLLKKIDHESNVERIDVTTIKQSDKGSNVLAVGLMTDEDRCIVYP